MAGEEKNLEGGHQNIRREEKYEEESELPEKVRRFFEENGIKGFSTDHGILADGTYEITYITDRNTRGVGMILKVKFPEHF